MSLSKRLHTIREAARTAFAVGSPAEPLTPDDVLLLEKIAAAIVQRRMAGPALLFLESAGPMNFLGSQALHFLTPILSLACETGELERAAHLLERRDAIPRLIAVLEAHAARSSSGKPLPQ
jgi:hypothetical protein